MRSLASIGFALALSTCAHAQWRVISLQGDEVQPSAVYSVQPGRQGGVFKYDHAAIWSGIAESAVDLYPSYSAVLGMEGDQQVGFILQPSGFYNASLWRGSADAFVNLNPDGWLESRAHATDGVRQGGWVSYDGEGKYAAIWSGTPESFVSLNPAWADGSSVYAMHGDVQGGYVTYPTHAGIWRGNADSWIDLHPSGAVWSHVQALTGTSQAGVAWIGPGRRAGVWYGTPDSWVDLHPAVGEESEVFGASGDYQVGRTMRPTRAAIWKGTRESWHDLHAHLPQHVDSSEAHSITEYRGVIVVGGLAYEFDPLGWEGILWIYCPGDFNGDGNLTASDFLAFQTAFGNEDPAADLDHNSLFNLFDFLAFQTAFGNGC